MDLSMKVKIQQDTIKQLNEEKEELRKANESLALQLENERMNNKELIDTSLQAKKFYEEKLLELTRLTKDYESINKEMRDLMTMYKKNMLMLNNQVKEIKEE